MSLASLIMFSYRQCVNKYASRMRLLSTVNASKSPFNPATYRLGTNLTKYGINLSKLAYEGKVDAVIGRHDEIERAIQILSRRSKNNPCFIGEPGVGKTAIVEGLASRIISGNVPDWLKDRVIVTLDLASMLAGSRFRGEFEERLKGVLNEIAQSGDRIILFIDEIHIIVGAGGAEGAIDASNILKPPLARGLVKCIGATTTDEFRKYIEKDAALARRFQAVVVSEPSTSATIDILKGVKGKLEDHHQIIISDDAIASAVELSAKYLNDRRFPDKALDLIDEASSKLRIKMAGLVDECLSVDKNIALLEAKGDSDQALKLHQLKNSSKFQADAWLGYKAFVSQTALSRSRIGALVSELSIASDAGNEERVAYIRDVELKELHKEALVIQSEYDKKLALLSETIAVPPYVLQSNDIADIMSRMTGIPLGSLLEGERKNLLNMEQVLQDRVIGQETAIRAVCQCIRRSRVGLNFHDRPLGTFLMLGGTGVGKTEVAKTLSEFLFNDSKAMTRIDMSEYMERFSVSRLIGSPPGYVGYEEGGFLTESVRRKPYQVILLDEFEKAHREVSNLLLQVFDEGRLSDSHGRLIDFRNTVIIMTSNLLTKETLDIADVSQQSELVRKVISAHFAPEFVNRLDECVIFNPLNEESINRITNLQLHRVVSLLDSKQIALRIDDSVKDWISKTGFDKSYGARPVKRLIQTAIVDPLATLMLEGKIVSGSKIVTFLEHDDINTTAFTKIAYDDSKPVQFYRSISE